MKQSRYICLFVLILLFSTAALAQKKPTFTSAYTALSGKACKVLKGDEGQDDALLCNGPAGYRIRVYSAAAVSIIGAENSKTGDSFPIATVSLGYDPSKTRAEWRLANGKPFALIIRIPVYAKAADDDPGVGKRTGEKLMVIGLSGHVDISESIDGKTRNANVKARAAADKAYKP